MASNNTIRTCCWWLAGGEKQCGKPTPYKVVRGEDGVRRREYAHFCAEHQARADAQALEQEEGEDDAS
jgi:hypothetical protein